MKVQHSLLFPCILALALAQASFAAQIPRQLPTATTASPPPPTSNTLPPAVSTTQTTSTPQNLPPQTALTSSDSPVVTSQPPLTATSAPTSSASLATNAPSTPTTAAPSVATSEEAIITTNSEGDPITTTVTNAAESSATTAAPTNTSSSDNSDGGGLSTGSIIGLSVAAGVAVIGIIAFFIWKFTRKRFSDFDDNEAIKWPELNTHSGDTDSHPLPARDTGRAGFETGSEADLSRVNSTSNYSTPDFGTGGSDPYAVPPLPHLNPNQPYRDDPTAASGYYDPYRGPVPGTIENGNGDWHPEAYAMTQLGGSAGRASPAVDYNRYETGRQSPASHAMYGGTNSPAPQVPYGGRASPGPQAVYSTGRMSPGPNTAYGGTR